jgi:hypothetical protein
MSSSDEMRAALEVAELEEKLVAAKNTKKGPDNDLKLKLREARRVYRELREAEPAGDGTARPAAVKASARVKE